MKEVQPELLFEDVKEEEKEEQDYSSSIWCFHRRWSLEYSEDDNQTPRRRHRHRTCRVVRFSTVEVREYDMLLGDHPFCEDGLALTLDWTYHPEIKLYSLQDNNDNDDDDDDNDERQVTTRGVQRTNVRCCCRRLTYMERKLRLSQHHYPYHHTEEEQLQRSSLDLASLLVDMTDTLGHNNNNNNDNNNNRGFCWDSYYSTTTATITKHNRFLTMEKEEKDFFLGAPTVEDMNDLLTPSLLSLPPPDLEPISFLSQAA